MLPEVGFINPDIQRSKVVFPARLSHNTYDLAFSNINGNISKCFDMPIGCA